MPASVELLIERDGESCVWCGRRMWRRELTLEHVCPRSRSGSSLPENLLVACRPCNRGRRSQAAVSFARQRELQGHRPRWALLERALCRLAGSDRRAHRRYGEAQLRHLPTRSPGGSDAPGAYGPAGTFGR